MTLYAAGTTGQASPDQQHSRQHGTKPAEKGRFRQPRLIRTAPNGDLFVADSGGGIIFVLRGLRPNGKAAQVDRFTTGLEHPFGIAFFPASDPKFVYVANMTSVVRFAYHAGDPHASGRPQTIVQTLPGYAQLAGGGHWTRDLLFSKDGQRMLVSVARAQHR